MTSLMQTEIEKNCAFQGKNLRKSKIKRKKKQNKNNLNPSFNRKCRMILKKK
jgi:hypothetical protein